MLLKIFEKQEKNSGYAPSVLFVLYKRNGPEYKGNFGFVCTAFGGAQPQQQQSSGGLFGQTTAQAKPFGTGTGLFGSGTSTVFGQTQAVATQPAFNLFSSQGMNTQAAKPGGFTFGGTGTPISLIKAQQSMPNKKLLLCQAFKSEKTNLRRNGSRWKEASKTLEKSFFQHSLLRLSMADRNLYAIWLAKEEIVNEKSIRDNNQLKKRILKAWDQLDQCKMDYAIDQFRKRLKLVAKTQRRIKDFCKKIVNILLFAFGAFLNGDEISRNVAGIVARNVFYVPPIGISRMRENNIIKAKIDKIKNLEIKDKRIYDDKFDYRKANYESLQTYLAKADWTNLFEQCITVNDFYFLFLELTKKLMKNFVSEKKKLSKPSNLPKTRSQIADRSQFEFRQRGKYGTIKIAEQKRTHGTTVRRAAARCCHITRFETGVFQLIDQIRDFDFRTDRLNLIKFNPVIIGGIASLQIFGKNRYLMENLIFGQKEHV
uniref:Uncharacterized protein n=1 Tax=Romanomermis culicivorax TaxID=13658 RepID=A0A915KTJ0_ROMCU